MSDEIKVKICVGTTCYVMGGGDLLIIKDLIPEHMQEYVSVSMVACLGRCRKYGASKAPFVEVNDEVLTNCSTVSVLSHIEGLRKGAYELR